MKKVIWILTSCLLVLSLVLASCAPASITPITPTTSSTPTIPTTPTATTPASPNPEMMQDSLGRLVEKPKYGGWTVIPSDYPTQGFDDTITGPHNCRTMVLTHEKLGTSDWTRGPTGTNEFQYQTRATLMDAHIGLLLESWELVDPETVVLHVRQGVHFQNIPPANGREMTAQDVAFNINRQFTAPKSYIHTTFPTWFQSVTATDKWTVVVKGKESTDEKTAWAYQWMLDLIFVWPPEVIEKYGNTQDWKVACGTGPFTITDYVPGSSVTYEKNPNYWREHPLYKGYSMPFVDGVKQLYILDVSTLVSAFRTGKIDLVEFLNRIDAESLMKTNPEIKWRETLPSSIVLWGRIDTKPFDDVRVRRALCMGINRKSIKEDYYGGKAVWYTFPLCPYTPWYIPLEELPESCRELWDYNPEKAKQLLAEAGFPKGFETNVICQVRDSDLLSIVKADLAKIGVDMQIDPREFNVWKSIYLARSHTQMVMTDVGIGETYSFVQLQPGVNSNVAIINDPYITERERAAYSWELLKDPERRIKNVQEEVIRVFEQAYSIEMPAAYMYTMWQPWLKHFNGEHCLSKRDLNPSAIYSWIDQNLKMELGR